MKLMIDAEDKLTGHLWRCDFQQKYIEDITNKTGAYKKFQTFCKMLTAAIKQSQPNELYIDLLGQQDIEILKNKKQQAVNNRSSHNFVAGATNQFSPKKYLILTHVGEFEKIHYPLPMQHMDEPDIDVLRKTMERMQNQYLMARSNTFSIQSAPIYNQQNSIDDFALIEVENQDIRNEIEQLEQTFSQSHSDFFKFSEQKQHAQSMYEKFRTDTELEINDLMDNYRRAEQELALIQNDVNVTKTSGFSLQSQSQNHNQSVASEQDAVKSQLDTLTSQLEEEKKVTGNIIEQQEVELREANKVFDEQKVEQHKMNSRIKELQTELETTINRIEQLQRGGGFGTGARKRPAGGSSFGAGSRNSSQNSRTSGGYQRNTSQTKYSPASRPVPNYMKNTRQNSYDRNSNQNRSNSRDRHLPSNYKPPHLRNSSGNTSNTRVSPNTRIQPNNRQPGNNRNPQVNRISPNRTGLTGSNRVSPGGGSGSRYDMNGRRISPANTNAARYDMNGRRISPANPATNNVQSRVYGNKGVSPTGQRTDLANKKPYTRPTGGNWDIYGRVKSKDRSGSGTRQQAAPKVNNFMKQSDNKTSNTGSGSTGVYDRLYGRSAGARNISNTQRSNSGQRNQQPQSYGGNRSRSRDNNNNTSNVNITQKNAISSNKENSQRPQQSKYQAKSASVSKQPVNTSSSAVEPVQQQDIDSKLSRLQDLLKQAKNNS